MTDAELQFLEQLYRQHYQRLFLYAKAIVKNEHLAEEAVQDTFHIACSKIAEVRRSENAAGWLVQTLKNVLRNMERKTGCVRRDLQMRKAMQSIAKAAQELVSYPDSRVSKLAKQIHTCTQGFEE